MTSMPISKHALTIAVLYSSSELNGVLLFVSAQIGKWVYLQGATIEARAVWKFAAAFMSFEIVFPAMLSPEALISLDSWVTASMHLTGLACNAPGSH